MHAFSIKHFFLLFVSPQYTYSSTITRRNKEENQEVLSVVHDFLMLNSLRYRGWHFEFFLNYSEPIRVKYVDGMGKLKWNRNSMIVIVVDNRRHEAGIVGLTDWDCELELSSQCVLKRWSLDVLKWCQVKIVFFTQLKTY